MRYYWYVLFITLLINYIVAFNYYMLKVSWLLFIVYTLSLLLLYDVIILDIFYCILLTLFLLQLYNTFSFNHTITFCLLTKYSPTIYLTLYKYFITYFTLYLLLFDIYYMMLFLTVNCISTWISLIDCINAEYYLIDWVRNVENYNDVDDNLLLLYSILLLNIP